MSFKNEENKTKKSVDEKDLKKENPNKESKCDNHKKKCHCEKTCTCGCYEGKKCKCHDACEYDECDNIHEDQMQEAFEYFELAQRIQAEFDNYRKRTQQAEKDAKDKGIALAVEKILPVIDSIDNAKRQVKDENFIKALDIVNNQIIQSFEALGVKRIEAVGKIFDPNLHNAIMTGTEEGKQEDEIIEEFQAGFIMNEKVIRHSVVKVNK